jgi:primosomal protein N'
VATAIREGMSGRLIMVCPSCGRKVTCGNCNRVLEAHPGATYNRRVPRKSGKKCLVCPACASEIDRQVSIDVEALEDDLVAALPVEPETVDWGGF